MGIPRPSPSKEKSYEDSHQSKPIPRTGRRRRHAGRGRTGLCRCRPGPRQRVVFRGHRRSGRGGGRDECLPCVPAAGVPATCVCAARPRVLPARAGVLPAPCVREAGARVLRTASCLLRPPSPWPQAARPLRAGAAPRPWLWPRLPRSAGVLPALSQPAPTAKSPLHAGFFYGRNFLVSGQLKAVRRSG